MFIEFNMYFLEHCVACAILGTIIEIYSVQITNTHRHIVYMCCIQVLEI